MREDFKGVIFRIDREDYAISISQVVSIERMKETTKIPQMPSHVRGVIELRGSVLPVIGLREALNVKSIEDDDEQTRIIVVNVGEQMVGMIVDAATDVLDIPENSIQKPQISFNQDQSFLVGIVKMENRLITLLDIEKLLKNVAAFDALIEIKDELSKGMIVS